MTQLTPIEIERHEFKTVWRGYDPAEVRAFLGQIADQLTTLTRDQERAADELELKAQRLSQVDDYETRLRDALLAATQLGEQNREEARREGELIIKEAEIKADQLLFAGRQDQQRLVHEIESLKRQRERLSVELRSVIESHLRTLENHEEHLKRAQREPQESWRDWERDTSTSVERSRFELGDPSETLSSARELTVALASNLDDDELTSSHKSVVNPPRVTPPLPDLSKRMSPKRDIESEADHERAEEPPPIVTPSLPHPLTTRPLTERRTEVKAAEGSGEKAAGEKAAGEKVGADTLATMGSKAGVNISSNKPSDPNPEVSPEPKADLMSEPKTIKKPELKSGVAKLQHVLAATPRLNPPSDVKTLSGSAVSTTLASSGPMEPTELVERGAAGPTGHIEIDGTGGTGGTSESSESSESSVELSDATEE